LFQAATGVQLEYSQLLSAGERVLNLERAFIVREGFRRADDRVPLRMSSEAVPYFNYPPLSADILDGMLDEYYQANGWDLATSIPTESKLCELGLEDVAREMSTILSMEKA